MLVLGYQGTLRDGTADPNSLSSFPPKMEDMIEPLLALAARRLNRDSLRFTGEPLPLESLLRLLRDRLCGILTLPLAEHLSVSAHATPLPVSELTRQFPVLGGLLSQSVCEFADAVCVFRQRLEQDSGRLAAWLGLASLPPVDSIAGTKSDTHPGGHTVLQVNFHGGLRIYYKPRPVTGEWLWHGLLETMSAMQTEVPFPAARVLEGGGSNRYGWTSAIPSDESSGGTEIPIANTPAYWRSAGGVLCLAYHAGLADLHMGNILATADGPTVADAECLGSLTCQHVHSSGDPRTAAIAAVAKSLISTGLLCQPSPGPLPDVSGLFGRAAPVAGISLPRWQMDRDGIFRLSSAPAVLIEHSNTPAAMSALQVLPHLLEGYRHTAGVLLCCRRKLTARRSAWRMVLETRHAPRMLLRDTLRYAMLMSQSLQPVYLRSQARRHRMICDALESSAPMNLPRALLRAEARALLNLHIPRMHLAAGSRSLVDGSARRLAHRFAERPGELVLQRLEDLSAEGIESVQVPALLLALLGG